MVVMNIELVIVKDVMNRLLIKAVCHSTANMVYVTSPEALKNSEKGLSKLFPVGFSRSRVFAYNGEKTSASIDVKSLKPWTG
jgi:hypothetical protein